MTPETRPLLGLHFRTVLGDALRAERGLARRLSRVARWSARHRVRPELVLLLRAFSEPVPPRVGRGDDVARSADFLRPAGREFLILSRRARCRRWSNGPTASPAADDLGSPEAVSSRSSAHSPQRRCSPRHTRPAPPRSSCLRGTPSVRRTHRGPSRGIHCCHGRHVGDGGVATWVNPDMPWNEEIRQRGHDGTPGGEPRTVALMLPLVSELDVRRSFRQSACQLSSCSTPTTRSSRPRGASTSLTAYRVRIR